MTNKKQHRILKLSEHFKDSVSSRAAIINLFAIDLSKVKTLEIDFSNIDFVSRSATHQLIKEKERLEKELHIKVSFCKRCREVKEMFDIVSKSLKTAQSAKNISTVHRVIFSTPKEFRNFLQRI